MAKTAMQHLMHEVVLCGGSLWTRQGLYQELLRTTYADPHLARRCADYIAFGANTLTATEAEIAARVGTPLDRRSVKPENLKERKEQSC